MILFRLTLNPSFLEPIAVGRGSTYNYNTYFFEKSYIQLNDDETYVDVGAFTGDTIQQFLFATKGKFKHIYSFEPSPENNLEIRSRINRLQEFYLRPLKPSITLIEKGVWSSDTVLSFASAAVNDLGGHFVESGNDMTLASASNIVNLPVTTIDGATDRDASFIKFEAEGSELEGLIGARYTIERNKPKLAVAVYHKSEDILVLPEYIGTLDLGYKIGFRQHDPYKLDAGYIYCI